MILVPLEIKHEKMAMQCEKKYQFQYEERNINQKVNINIFIWAIENTAFPHNLWRMHIVAKMSAMDKKKSAWQNYHCDVIQP